MRGSTLVEFLCAISFFFVLVLSGFKALDAEMGISDAMIQRTRPEEESNYRLLALKAFFQNSASRFKKSSALAEVPYFFSGLNFGQPPSAGSFSLARALSDPAPFIHEGSVWRIPIDSPVTVGSILTLAGITTSGEFAWSYGRVLTIVPLAQELNLTMELFLPPEDFVSGMFAPVEIHGFVHTNNALYWISPAGQSQPYFSPVDEFAYQWSGTRLKISWRTGLIESSFTVTP